MRPRLLETQPRRRRNRTHTHRGWQWMANVTAARPRAAGGGARRTEAERIRASPPARPRRARERERRRSGRTAAPRVIHRRYLCVRSRGRARALPNHRPAERAPSPPCLRLWFRCSAKWPCMVGVCVSVCVCHTSRRFRVIRTLGVLSSKQARFRRCRGSFGARIHSKPGPRQYACAPHLPRLHAACACIPLIS